MKKYYIILCSISFFGRWLYTKVTKGLNLRQPKHLQAIKCSGAPSQICGDPHTWHLLQPINWIRHKLIRHIFHIFQPYDGYSEFGAKKLNAVESDQEPLSPVANLSHTQSVFMCVLLRPILSGFKHVTLPILSPPLQASPSSPWRTMFSVRGNHMESPATTTKKQQRKKISKAC